MTSQIKAVSSEKGELPSVLEGWGLMKWFELSKSTSEAGNYQLIGYYADQVVATEAGRGKGWYGSDGRVTPVWVLSNDGQAGFLVNEKLVVLMSDEDQQREAAVQRALKKLTPEERKLLGVNM